MAESLDDGEFWLPPKFLNDDDVFLENNPKNGVKQELGFYPYESPLGFSPVESLIGSSENESDEEEYIAELTRQMAHSTLENNSVNGWGIGNKCGCKKENGNGNGNGYGKPTLDLLYAAAGQVSKMRKNEEEEDEGRFYGFNSNNKGLLLVPPSKPYQQLQASQFLHLKRQQLIEQLNSRRGQTKGITRYHQPQQCSVMSQNRARNCRSGVSSVQAWASQKQNMNNQSNGSGMRAVFLGGSRGKRECAGTGVFLPRQANSIPEPRKKQGTCSTVLIPARVMHALNLNMEDMYVHPQLHSRFPPIKNDASMRIRSGDSFQSHQKLNLRPAAAAVMNHDILLPQEWTY